MNTTPELFDANVMLGSPIGRGPGAPATVAAHIVLSRVTSTQLMRFEGNPSPWGVSV